METYKAPSDNTPKEPSVDLEKTVRSPFMQEKDAREARYERDRKNAENEAPRGGHENVIRENENPHHDDEYSDVKKMFTKEIERNNKAAEKKRAEELKEELARPNKGVEEDSDQPTRTTAEVAKQLHTRWQNSPDREVQGVSVEVKASQRPKSRISRLFSGLFGK